MSHRASLATFRLLAAGALMGALGLTACKHSAKHGAGQGGSGGSSITSGGAPVSGGGAGGNGGSGGGVSADLSGCDGFEVRADGVLDVNLEAVRVSGNVTVNGVALPNAMGDRGQLLFVDAKEGAQATVVLGSTGPGTYSLRLPPGSFDVMFVANPALCDGKNPAPMPCGGGTLLEQVKLGADGVLDIDIPMAHVSGAVTLEGATLPDESADRGSLRFVGTKGASATTVGFADKGAASYVLSLLPGQYSIELVGNAALCQGPTPARVPCNSGLVRKDVNVSTGVLDIDLQAVQVSGAVTLANAVLPDEQLGRGSLVFVRDGASLATRAFDPTGPATYRVTLLPGAYDIAFEANSKLCGGTAPSQVPCNGGTVLNGVSLMADGVVDVDLRAVTISGNATLNGAAFPKQASDRGALRFTRHDGGSALTKSFGLDGAAAYQVSLLAGTYDVLYEANAALCDAQEEALAPCNSGPLIEGQKLEANGVLDVNVPAVRVTGSVTVNGAQPADEEMDRGQLVFALKNGGALPSAAFDRAGPVSFALTLLPGSYDVRFKANPMLCAGMTVPHISCVSGTLLPGLQLQASGDLPVDVATRVLSGAVTLLGQPLPMENGSRGTLSFTRLGESAAEAVATRDLQSAGAASYGIAILPGFYAVSHVANPALCGPNLAPQVPCASQVALGCD